MFTPYCATNGLKQMSEMAAKLQVLTLSAPFPRTGGADPWCRGRIPSCWPIMSGTRCNRPMSAQRQTRLGKDLLRMLHELGPITIMVGTGEAFSTASFIQSSKERTWWEVVPQNHFFHLSS